MGKGGRERARRHWERRLKAEGGPMIDVERAFRRGQMALALVKSCGEAGGERKRRVGRVDGL